ncbi:SDR family oxidoreductase [Micromonospora sp. NPDC003776]
MTAPILVTGGTGTLGRLVTPLLREAGHPVRVLSRRGGRPADSVEHVTADLLTGTGIEPALRGVRTVLHLAGGQKGDDEATRHLVRAAQRAGVRHLVYISVVGADRVPLAWLRSKLDAERAIADSGIPWTTLRAAQFHDLVLVMAEKMAKLPIVPVPGGLRFQPVDAREVADRLVELALGAPAGLVPDLVGPGVQGLDELMRGYLRAVGKRRPFLPVRMPGRAGRAYRNGDNLTLDGATTGTRTWEAFLAERLPHRHPAPARP